MNVNLDDENAHQGNEISGHFYSLLSAPCQKESETVHLAALALLNASKIAKDKLTA